jgi:hypothetical protein
MKTGYVFADKNALFVGNTKYDSVPLKFYSEEPTNVMLSGTRINSKLWRRMIPK